MVSASSAGMLISKPSSPVYPERDTIQSAPRSPTARTSINRMPDDFGNKRGEDRFRRRPLQGEQAAIVEPLDHAQVLQGGAQILFVGVLARGIGDDREAIAEICDHQIVADAALLVGQ